METFDHVITAGEFGPPIIDDMFAAWLVMAIAAGGFGLVSGRRRIVTVIERESLHERRA